MLQPAITHDFRNVLALIFGNCELATREGPKMKHILRIKDAVARAVDLLESDLSDGDMDDDATLDFSQPVNLNTLALEVAEILRSALVRLDKVRLELALTEADPWVMGSSLRMFRSVLNLCLNARDAMIGAGGTLKISTRFEEGSALFAVSDTGKGIAEEKMGSIWTPKGSPNRKHGHGLQVLRETVGRMGGTIGVESKLGQGTTFTISLPAMTV
jgi:signal transduction histidine kinase